MTRRGISIIIVFLGLLLAGGWLYLKRDASARNDALEQTGLDGSSADNGTAQPGPLRWGIESNTPFLTKQGTIEETNKRRAEAGLPAFRENMLLNRSAEAKVREMFARQYFAHESPEGRGPSDLAKTAGYNFLLVGENLALGNFKDNAELLQAWMDSPGHRANILKKNYSEIGVSVIEGIFEGKKTWIAVQEFGRPASDCAEVSHSLESLLAGNKLQLSEMEKQIDTKQREIAATKKNTPEYNQRANEYNQLVEDYNDLAARTKQLAEQYNADVDRYNNCLHAATL